MAFKFKIEHIALQPRDYTKARRLLSELGLDEWFTDEMQTFGRTWENENVQATTALDFNYQADCSRLNPANGERRPIELEIMGSCSGHNWLYESANQSLISHFGMQVTWEQLEEVRTIMSGFNILVAQEVVTLAHKNPAISGTRRYKKVIFDTRPILGVDLEFNVLINIQEA